MKYFTRCLLMVIGRWSKQTNSSSLHTMPDLVVHTQYTCVIVAIYNIYRVFRFKAAYHTKLTRKNGVFCPTKVPKSQYIFLSFLNARLMKFPMVHFETWTPCITS
uniref:Uncharacterized protein n=1 Tax=Cacopsylla melanoneura TaxID=428564 RepID=A0A8D8YWE3_9HEMI